MSRLFIWCLLLGVAYAAVARGPLPKKPAHLAHKEGCYIEQVKDVVPFGTTVTPIGICMRIECGRSLLEYASCGVYGTSDEKCHITEMDLTKPYPDCCPIIKCEIENQV